MHEDTLETIKTNREIKDISEIDYSKSHRRFELSKDSSRTNENITKSLITKYVNILFN
jgi:hypothetical protein